MKALKLVPESRVLSGETPRVIQDSSPYQKMAKRLLLAGVGPPQQTSISFRERN
jgi:hypothetical protein